MKRNLSILPSAMLMVLFIGILAQMSLAQGFWSPIRRETTADLVSSYFITGERGFVGGDDGYFAMTNDGGYSWTRQILTTTSTVNEIYFRNEDNGYVLTGNNVLISNDKGVSWRENKTLSSMSFDGMTPEYLSIRFSSKKRGWLVGSLANSSDEVVDSLVLTSDDSGETWKRVILPSKGEIYHVDFVNDDWGWLVGSDGSIFHTQDGGKTWNSQSSGVTVSLFNVDFRDKQNGVVVGGSGTILRTENGGSTWEKISSPGSKSLMRVSFINDKTGWIVGKAGMILRTDDKGKTWTKQTGPINESFYGFYMDKRGGWAVGEKGLIMKYVREK